MVEPQTLAHPHLTTLVADLDAARRETERLRDTLSDAQLTWRPEPGVWSVADCFEHLRKVDKAYCRRIAEALERADAGVEDYRPGWFARKFIHFVSPDSTFKLRAPKGIRPKATLSAAGAQALDRFLDQQAVLRGLLHAADGKNLNTGKFSSPLAAVVRFTLGEALTMLVRHEQRHLGQALRLTERPDFPTA